MKYFNFLVETPDEAVERIDDIGGPHSHANYPWGWAQAGNTPFKWYKQNTHEGGVHVPLIVHWPDGIKDRGAPRPVPPRERHRPHHLRDPRHRGARRSTGDSSSSPSPACPCATPSTPPTHPSSKRVQYYEMMGHRAIYADGWKAVTRHQPGVPFEDDDWELYHLAEDRSECHNLAAAMPDKVAELVDAVVGARPRSRACCPSTTGPSSCSSPATATDRPIPPTGATPTSRPCHRCPDRWPRRSAGGAGTWRPPSSGREGRRGVLYASGTENSGVSLFVQDDRLVFDYNCFGDHHVVESEADRPGGRRRWSGCGSAGRGRAAEATLIIDGRTCGSHGRPVRHDHDLQCGPEHRLRPRLAGERALLRPFPLRGTGSSGSTSTLSAGPRRTRPRRGRSRTSGRPCPASEAATRSAGERAEAPASTSMTEPVMWRAASDARKTTAAVISSGSSHGTGWTWSAAMPGATSSAVGCSRSGRIRPVEGIVVDHRGGDVARGDGVDGHPEARPVSKATDLHSPMTPHLDAT